jgi:hypothetical protein
MGMGWEVEYPAHSLFRRVSHSPGIPAGEVVGGGGRWRREVAVSEGRRGSVRGTVMEEQTFVT